MGLSAGSGTMFPAPRETGAGIASVLGNTTPLLTVALAAPALGEPITRAKLTALVLGLAGVIFVVWPALTESGPAMAWGPLLPLTAAAGFAVSSVLVKRIDARGAVLQVAAWQLLLGGLPLLGLSRLFESSATLDWTPGFLVLLGFLAVIGTALTTAVWYWLIQRDEVGRLSLALFLVPPGGLGIALVLFGERLEPLEVLGVGFVFAALAVMALETPRTGHG